MSQRKKQNRYSTSRNEESYHSDKLLSRTSNLVARAETRRSKLESPCESVRAVSYRRIAIVLDGVICNTC